MLAFLVAASLLGPMGGDTPRDEEAAKKAALGFSFDEAFGTAYDIEVSILSVGCGGPPEEVLGRDEFSNLRDLLRRSPKGGAALVQQLTAAADGVLKRAEHLEVTLDPVFLAAVEGEPKVPIDAQRVKHRVKRYGDSLTSMSQGWEPPFNVFETPNAAGLVSVEVGPRTDVRLMGSCVIYDLPSIAHALPSEPWTSIGKQAEAGAEAERPRITIEVHDASIEIEVDSSDSESDSELGDSFERAWFERRGDAWLPIVWWESYGGYSDTVFVLEYADREGDGFPSRILELFWESDDGDTQLGVNENRIRRFAAPQSALEIALPTKGPLRLLARRTGPGEKLDLPPFVADKPETWPADIRTILGLK